jgi:hypothetical protein
MAEAKRSKAVRRLLSSIREHVTRLVNAQLAADKNNKGSIPFGIRHCTIPGRHKSGIQYLRDSQDPIVGPRCTEEQLTEALKICNDASWRVHRWWRLVVWGVMWDETEQEIYDPCYDVDVIYDGPEPVVEEDNLDSFSTDEHPVDVTAMFAGSDDGQMMALRERIAAVYVRHKAALSVTVDE